MGQSLATNQPAKVEVADWVKSYSNYQIVSARDYKYPVNALAPNHDSSRDEYKLGKHFRKFNRAQDQKVVYGSSPFTTSGSFPLTMFVEGTLNDVSDTYANFLVCLKDTSTLTGTSWIGILSNGNKVRAACWDGGGYREYQSTTTYTASQLLRIVAVFKEDKTFDIYVDGSLVNTTLVNGNINYAAFNTSYLALGGAISSSDAGNTSVSLAGAFKGYPPKEFIENIWSCLKVTEEQTVLVPKYVPCTKQPQGPVEVDTSNPLTIGLVDITHSLTPMDKAMGFSGSAGYLENTTAGAKIVSSTSGIRLTKPINHCVLGTSNGITISTLVFGRFGIADNGLSYGLERITGSSLVGIFSTLTAGRARLIVEDSTGAVPVYVQSTGTVYSDSAPCVATLVLVGTSLKFYINGILNTTATIPQFQVIVDSARIAAYKLGTTANPHFIWGATWGRALSDIEVRQLSANPWQLFHQRTLTAVREEAVVEYKQPYKAAPIDDTNSLSSGLVAFESASSSKLGGISIVPRPDGVVWSQSNSAPASSSLNTTLPNLTAATVMYLGKVTYANSLAGPFGRLLVNSNGSILVSNPEVRVFGGTFNVPRDATFDRQLIAMWSSGSTSRLIIDGVEQSITGGTIASGSISGATTLFNEPTLDRAPSGEFYAFAIWNRVLSADELNRIIANPWQIFKPIAPSISTKENRKPIIRESNMLGTSKRKLSDINNLALFKRPATLQPQSEFKLRQDLDLPGTLVCVGSYINQPILSTNNVTTVNTQYGKALIGSSLSAAVRVGKQPLFDSTKTAYVISYIHKSSIRRNFAGYYASNDNTEERITINANASGVSVSGRINIGILDALGNVFSISVSSSVFVLDGAYSIVVIPRHGGAAEIWVNGSKLTNVVYGSDTAITGGGYSAINWNYMSQNVDDAPDGAMNSQVMLFARLQTQNFDAKSISSNPWQIFRQSSNLPLLK